MLHAKYTLLQLVKSLGGSDSDANDIHHQMVGAVVTPESQVTMYEPYQVIFGTYRMGSSPENMQYSC